MARVTAGARLDRLPIGSFHKRILALIAGGLFLDSFDVYLAGGVIGALVKEGWSDLAHNAQFISATFAGMLIGALAAGWVGDRYGRRFSYQANLLIFGLASLAGAAAPSMGWLIAARFVMGIGLGAEIVVGYASLIEFVPPQQRGKWGAGLSALTNTALFVASVTGLYVIPNFGWRWMFVIVGVGALIVWYLRKAMPESPRWLESKGRVEEADRILDGIEAEIARATPLPPVRSEPAAPEAGGSMAELFSKELISRTLVGSLIVIVLTTVIYGFIAWLPTFFVKQGLSIVTSLGFTTLMSFGGPLGAVIGMAIGDKVSRKSSIAVFCFVAAAFGLAYPFAASPVTLTIIGFGLVTTIFILVALTFALYVPETFPTRLRLRGTGVCNAAGRAMTIVTPYIIVAVFGAYGVFGVVVILAGALMIGGLVVALFGVETRGKPLESLAPG